MKIKTLLVIWFILPAHLPAFASADMSLLKEGERIADFRVDHLYSGAEGKVVGAKFLHVPTGAPVFLLQLESVPQVFTWVDNPAVSNRGLPHAMEHVLITKGVKGRYRNLLNNMRLSVDGASTLGDFVDYGLSSGSGVHGFFECFHALLDSLYDPDFSDIEAEREFYHFAVAGGEGAKKTLIEAGGVYNEMLSRDKRYKYLYELNRRVLGERNPYAFDSGGDPDAMRDVTPAEIRRFHDRYYRLGPGTGFIFSFPPQEDVPRLLQKISEEFQQYSKSGAIANGVTTLPDPGHPKYPIQPSGNLTPGIYPFPGPHDEAPGVIHLSWEPVRSNGLYDLRMLELLFHALAGGQDSLLYKSLVDSKARTLNSGATAVDYDVSVDVVSPFFPFTVLEVSGVPGNRISTDSLEALRTAVVSKIREVAYYPDQSEVLRAFNDAALARARTRRRSDRVWSRNYPGFGNHIPDIAWKTYLLSLETDPSFVRSLSEDQAWRAVEERLSSGRNLWTEIIEKFHLLETPYVTACSPSAKLLEETEKRRQERVKRKIQELENRYGTSDEQEALSRFAQDELVKTKEIEQIDARVPDARFTDHPPMTPDDGVRSQQFQIEGVPVIASIFKLPPTIDIGVSFDLRGIPRRYFKYLPLLPKCLDSLGLRKGTEVTSYSELYSKIQRDVFTLSTGYETNPASKRADFTIRASAIDVHEFRRALRLIRDLMEFNDLDAANADRLRDLAAARVAANPSYFTLDASTADAGQAFRYQNDELFLALSSRLTTAHFDNRSKWLLHVQVAPDEIDRLNGFARETLASAAGMSRKQIAQKLEELGGQGLERELVEYWQSNLGSYPEAELAAGLQQLADETMEDLRQGPAQTIEDLKRLQKIVLSRHALHLDLTLSEPALGEVEEELTSFVRSIPERSPEGQPERRASEESPAPVAAKLEKRYQLSHQHAPWYVGLVNPSRRAGGDVAFFADSPGYAQVDRKSLVRVLAGKLGEGLGPESFQMRTHATGLTYHNYIFTDLSYQRTYYYADRSPDIPSLVRLVNQMASQILESNDPRLIDYALSNSFFYREMFSFSERGKAAAQDIRDGNEPEKVRRFYEEILKLRKDRNLLPDLVRNGVAAICGVLVRDDCQDQQRALRSSFFFVGSEEVLADVEKRLSMPRLLRLYASDFWLDF
jgi:Zn-dependent M16 (insulinase) family peptidase